MTSFEEAMLQREVPDELVLDYLEKISSMFSEDRYEVQDGSLHDEALGLGDKDKIIAIYRRDDQLITPGEVTAVRQNIVNEHPELIKIELIEPGPSDDNPDRNETGLIIKIRALIN